MFMKSEEKTGGPTDPIHGFEEVVQLLFKSKYADYTQHPLYESIQKYSFKVTPMPPPEGQDNGGLRRTFRDVSRDICQMPENKRNMLNCEQIFTLYLREFSSLVNETYYKKLMTFVLLFRDCLNIYGWQKRAENEVKEYYGQFDYDRKLKEKLESFDQMKVLNEYTAVNNGEFAPEIANEFVTVFYDETINGHLTRPEVIDLTQHLCSWLFAQKLTCSKLSMVSS